MSNSSSLMIHGGAGALEDLKSEASEAEYQWDFRTGSSTIRIWG
jgi:hypothetical protein